MSRELWEQVQEKLRGRAARTGEGGRTEAVKSPLVGKLFDENGEPLYVQGAAKGRRRYRYYVSKKVVRSESREAEQGWRISAPEIERIVTGAAQTMPLKHRLNGFDPVRMARRLPNSSSASNSAAKVSGSRSSSRSYQSKDATRTPKRPFSHQGLPDAAQAARGRNADGARGRPYTRPS